MSGGTLSLQSFFSRRFPILAAVVAAFLASAIANAAVQFNITDPATGDSLPGQTVMIFPPGDEEPFEATDDDDDGIILLPDADGAGWTARYTVNGRVNSVTGQVVTASAGGGSSVPLWQPIVGAAVIAAAVTADDNDGESTTTGGGGSGGGSGGGGGGGSGGISGAESSCMATVDVFDATISNPGGYIDAPQSGDIIEVGVLGDTTVIYEIDVPNLSVSMDLTCATSDDAGLYDCDGSALGTFNGESVTIDIFGAAFTADNGGMRDIWSSGGDLTANTSPDPYFASFATLCN